MSCDRQPHLYLWILLPILILPLVAISVIKKRWFTIATATASLWLVSWLYVNYWSPHPIQVSNPQLSLKILSLNCTWHKTTPENWVAFLQKEDPDVVFLQEVVRPHTKALKALESYQVLRSKGSEHLPVEMELILK